METALLDHAVEGHSLTAAGGTVAASCPGKGQGAAGCPTGVEQGVPGVEGSTAVYPEQAFVPPVTGTGMSAWKQHINGVYHAETCNEIDALNCMEGCMQSKGEACYSS